MTILGMQADMQRNSHFPGRYTAWDLNFDANGTVWPADNVNRIFRNRQYYNGSLPTSSGLSVFNNDLLKQTMLKHEAQFRDQVHELHRLYKRQKELMDEMKKIDLQKHHLSLETLQSNHVLSPKSSSCVQMPQFTSTSINLMHFHSPVSEAKCGIFPLHSSDGKAWLASNGLSCTESSSKAPESMESNCKMFGKKILDLELPAVFYIDSDEEGSSEVKLAEVSDKLTTDVKKLPEDRDRVDKKLSNCGSGCKSILSEGNFIPSNSLKTKVLADLNIPVKLEEESIPELADSRDPIIGCREASLQYLSEKSNSHFQVLSKEVNSKSQIVRDREADLDIVLQNKHKMQNECIPIYETAGRSRNGLNSFSQCDHATRHGLDDTNGKLCNENLHSVSRGVSPSSCKPVTTSDMCSSYWIGPLVDKINSESSSVSSWRHDMSGQSSKSVTGSSRPAGDYLSLSKSLLSSPKLCSSTLHGASWQNDFQLKGQAPSIKSISQNCNDENDPAFEHLSPAKCTKDFKHVMSVKSFDLNSVLPNLSGCSPEIAETPLNGKSSERRDMSFLNQAKSLGVHDAELKMVEECNSLDFKTTIGIRTNMPFIASAQCSSHASPVRNPSAIKDVEDKEKEMIAGKQLEFHHLADSKKQLAKVKLVAESEPCEKYPGYEVLIDLNTCFSVDESQLIPQSIEINLEPPVSPDNKESSPPRSESNENQREIPLLSSGREDADMQEALCMNAAEALASMSSSEIRTHLESTNNKPFKASRNSPLYWFARVASSVVDDPGTEFGVKIEVKDHGDHEEYLSDGIDYFEAMTLSLTDVKVEESWCRSNGQKEEEQSASFSRNQTKRGRTRSGRQQRKDFQNEILPSLASLSRYEVTEDLQTIGSLMEAAGAQWEKGSSRTAGRNGYAKLRRRSSARVSNTTESLMNTLRKQHSVDDEVDIQQRRPIEWGKITRRPRRPRCSSSNPRLILGQV